MDRWRAKRLIPNQTRVSRSLSNNSNPTGNHHKKYTVIGIFRSHSSAYSVVHEIYSSSVPSYRAGADLRPDGSCSSPSRSNHGEGKQHSL